tara:strand:+ start:183 stop:647 length:465 start_codon:yes stop_codon:yes gene_type:complete
MSEIHEETGEENPNFVYEPEPEPEVASEEITYDPDYEPDHYPKLTDEQHRYSIDLYKMGFHPDVESILWRLVVMYAANIETAERIVKKQCEKKKMSMYVKDYTNIKKFSRDVPMYKKLRPGHKGRGELSGYKKSYLHKLVPNDELHTYRADGWS